MRPFNLYEALDGHPVCMAEFPETRIVGLHLFTQSNHSHRLLGVVQHLERPYTGATDIYTWTPDGVFGHDDPDSDFSSMHLVMWEEGDDDNE